MGDVEVHEKFSILEDSKYTNFDMAINVNRINVVLLVVCSIFGCVSEVVCYKSLEPENK